ncbi:MAG: UvrD-helicase domain-containing protein, partial [Simplicispira sp.]|nr:UvrD-helicase domain-containing protein [Simplicispira sp.]
MSTSPDFHPQAITPTAEQVAIQTSSAKTLVIEANAGAAKTTTLALRMAQGWARGIRPEEFLALTYTDTACQALRAALKKIGVPAPVVQRFRIACFEEFCAQVLQDTLDAPVADCPSFEDLQPFVWQAVQRVQDNQDERWPGDLVLPSLGDSGFVDDFLHRARWLKGTMKDTLERGDHSVTPEYAAALGVDYTQLKVFLAFERIRRRELADQPMFRAPGDATYDLALWLHQGESVQHLRHWPRATRVLLVDEMHDVNQASFRVLQELLNTTQAYFCGVGDRDQVIYSDSGADSQFMGEAIAAHTGRSVVRLPLTPSHRFGPRLAAKAGRLAGKPYSSLSAHDTIVTLLAYDSAEDCVDQVLAQAQQWRATPRAKMADFAVLLRHAGQSVALENRLLAEGIPYTLSGFQSYLLRPEVLLVRGLLAVATDNFDSVTEPRTREALMQALVFFCGARIVVQGREDESQQALLQDAI